MPFTYMLRCCDQSLYTGYTVDMDKRLNMHLKGEASKYTRVRLPVEVVYVEEFDTKSDAMKRECAIKKLSKSEKEKLILSKPLVSQK
ncbi:endonuclease [Halalkalibacillus sediminis]|uniref:Endonuclease n=1 Tax=Halalkalibacillus sediminis TaxID=2018042 RepID=A0A2I0QVP3_9BACI|nr:GIY-YIG nuclease family protein [Halalkalibacillus sediminis]PKR78413.1 endonuclease [Halalkalibacillus sediminis]